MKKNCIKTLAACIFFFLLFFINDLHAQEPIVKFKIITAKKEPVAFASIKIMSIADSMHTIQKVTDSSGIASFQLTPDLLYRIQVTSVNYKPIDKTIKLSGAQNFFTFIAEETHTKLDNVVVTSTRPVIRQEDDKTIVDPENIAASSTNAFEIIEKTPGLFVDQDGNIYLSSTTPAQVYINGRELKMAAADVATMLKSLPPNAIATIEILRTPSAKYDASGSGGIVNVVLKKGVRIGLTGSVNAGLNQGKYENRFAGINLNNNNGALSTYLNIQYSKRNNYEQLTTDRLFTLDSLLSQHALTKYPTNSYYAGYGLAYQLNKKWEINYDGRVSFNRFNNSSNNISEIKKISTNELITENVADVSNKGNSLNVSQSFSTKYKWDSLGSEWTTDISYTFAPSNSNQDFISFFSKPNIPSSGGDGEIKSRLHFLSGQTNIQWKLPKKITLEAGVKTSYVRFSNNADYFRQSGSLRAKDDFRTALYHYD